MHFLSTVTAGVPIILLFISVANTQESPCMTPNQQPGSCVPISKCKPIVDILHYHRNKPLPPQLKLALQKLQCGQENSAPKVCCQGLSPTTTEPTVDVRITEPTDYSNHPSAALLPLKTCGPILGSKISGGNKTEIFEYPWAALLQYRLDGVLQFRCGGSLISSRYVLSAAHCVVGRDVDLVSVRLGEHTIDTERDCQLFGDEEVCTGPVQDVPVEKITPHPQYNTPKYANDVAVIRLSKEADMSTEQVRPVCLPITLQLQKTQLKIVTAMGWGTTESQSASNELLQAHINVVSNEICQEKFKRSVRISNLQFCAGDQKGVDTCQGDSGGPLVYPGFLSETRYIQFGIVSAGIGACDASTEFPGIYVRVTAYMKWILDQINK